MGSVCVCVCLHLRSCVWILKGCWPLEEVICLACLFSCYFHTCSFFSTTFSTPSEAPVVCTLNVCSIIWVFRWVKYCDDQFFWPVWGQRVALFLPPFVLPVHIPDNLTQPLLRETLVLLPPADLPLISISSISVTVNSPSLKHTHSEKCVDKLTEEEKWQQTVKFEVHKITADSRGTCRWIICTPAKTYLLFKFSVISWMCVCQRCLQMMETSNANANAIPSGGSRIQWPTFIPTFNSLIFSLTKMILHSC